MLVSQRPTGGCRQPIGVAVTSVGGCGGKFEATSVISHPQLVARIGWHFVFWLINSLASMLS